MVTRAALASTNTNYNMIFDKMAFSVTTVARGWSGRLVRQSCRTANG